MKKTDQPQGVRHFVVFMAIVVLALLTMFVVAFKRAERKPATVPDTNTVVQTKALAEEISTPALPAEENPEPEVLAQEAVSETKTNSPSTVVQLPDGRVEVTMALEPVVE